MSSLTLSSKQSNYHFTTGQTAVPAVYSKAVLRVSDDYDDYEEKEKQTGRIIGGESDAA